MVYKDQKFRLPYDNRRLIKESNDSNLDRRLFDSSPLKNVKQGHKMRYIIKLNKQHQYSQYSNIG